MTINPPPWTRRTPAELDAMLADRQGQWWDRFYADRARTVPFFGPAPDENLAGWVGDGVIAPGTALDLGCGNGRNAIFLAQRGFSVDAVDYSTTAIQWASQRATEAGAQVRFHHASVFELPIAAASYDLVYDSGCFHHMAPHRRADYIALVTAALKPGGWFAMTCFRPEGGSGLSDEQVYERRSLGGGLGYTDSRLRELWSGALEIRSLRQMLEIPEGSHLFGKSFLWVMLAGKP